MVPVGLGMLGVDTSSQLYKIKTAQLYAVQQMVGVGRGCMLPIHCCEQLSYYELVDVLQAVGLQQICQELSSSPQVPVWGCLPTMDLKDILMVVVREPVVKIKF